MQAWLPVVLLWFLALFTSVLSVITCIDRHLNNGKYRWTNIHKRLSPWILLAILTAAFIIANIWLISSSRDPDVKGMTEHAGLFIGLFVGLFFVACVVAAVLWKRYQKKASKPRNAEETGNTHSVRINRSSLQEITEFPATSFVNCNQTLDNTRSQHSQSAPTKAFSTNLCQAFHPNDEILILRDLSNPDEVFCINLSDPAAPVVKRKSAISTEEYLQELPK